MFDPERKYHTLRLILGDQLDGAHSWFSTRDPGVLYLVAELHAEATYVKHHVQKLCAFFAAMRRFAETLADEGHQVMYLTFDKTIKYNNLEELINVICSDRAISVFEYQAADEYRLRRQLRGLDLPATVTANECDGEHFLLPEAEFDEYIEAGRHNRMESFYRRMRRRLGLLMDGDEPVGGRWNYDAENRAKLKPADLQAIPEPLLFDNDVAEYLERIDRHGIPHFGRRAESLAWPVDRAQALELLDYFCAHGLPSFGRYQDAMTCRHEYGWSLFHSRLSFALNTKLLAPLEVVQAAIAAWETAKGGISIAQIEGFVRQIVGWREYVRAVYWVNMPAYAELNRLEAARDLPDYFWTGETQMNCMRHALGQSLEWAYAHHIQRLMIIGNFCLLTGIDPAQVDTWYLGVYIDAIEWVEMPNTRGMSQFADGGLIATKPYSAGGNYVSKMSDYCGSCKYDVRDKTGENACPFNSLYWDFMLRHRTRFESNPRSGMIYRSWDRQSAATRDATRARAARLLDAVDEL